MKDRKVRKALKKHRKLLIAIIVIVVLIVAILVMRSRRGDPTSSMPRETAQLRDVYTYNSFTGNVEPSSERNVVSLASAQALEVLVEEGDTVRTGDVIAVLDSSTVEYNIELQEAGLDATRVSNRYNIQDAQRNYENYKDSLDSGLNSTVLAALNQLDAAQTALETAQENLEGTEEAIEDGSYSATYSVYSARDSAETAKNTAKDTLTDAKNARKDVQNALNSAEEQLEAYTKTVSSGNLSMDVTYQQLKEAVDTLQANLSSAESAVSQAQSAYDSASTAYDNACTQFNMTKDDTLKNLRDAVKNAQTSYDQACTNYDSVMMQVDQQLGTYSDTLNKTRDTADTTSTELQIENLYDSLDDYTITAGCDGTITSINIDEGDMVSAGMTVATISNLNTMSIDIKVDEYSVVNTSVGSDVSIYLDAIDDEYKGVISWIADTATISNGVSYYEATVDFTADDLVRGGMSVEVRLTKADEKDALTVSLNALKYYEDNTAYVEIVDEEGNIIEQPVTLGASDGMYVQILSGLSEGDEVLTTSNSGEFELPISMLLGDD